MTGCDVFTFEARVGMATAVNVYSPRRGLDGVQVVLTQGDVGSVPFCVVEECVRRWAAYVTQWNNHAHREVIVCANEALAAVERLALMTEKERGNAWRQV